MNYIEVIDEIFSQFKGQKFAIKFWNGKTIQYGSGKSPAFTLIFKDEVTVQRLLGQGSLGFGESYMDESLQIEGDIESYLRMRHQFKHIKPSLRLAIARILSNKPRHKSRKDQISHHYDLGNDFFKLILDNTTMMYSSAFYKNEKEKLNSAQTNKIEFICKWLDLPSNSQVLDLGSGWAGFAKIAAQKFKWNVIGLTLSQAQLAYSQDLTEKEKLQKKVVFKEQDFVKALPSKKFDGAVIIESIEHVGQNNLQKFFKDVAKVLKSGAPFIIQTTGRYEIHRVDKWTLKYVFPGGYLPSKGELLKYAQDAGFTVELFRDDTDDYIRTMTIWIQNLEKNQKTIEKMFDKSFYRLWYLWMHGAKVNFEIGDMSLFRIKLRRA